MLLYLGISIRDPSMKKYINYAIPVGNPRVYK